MGPRFQFTASTLLALSCFALMGYAIATLSGMPYVLAAVLLWLGLVAYAVGRAWWVDARELVEVRRSRS